MSTPIVFALQKEIKTNELQSQHNKRQAHSHKSHAAIHASKARDLTLTGMGSGQTIPQQ